MSIIVLLVFSQLYNLHNLYHQAKIRLFCAIKKETLKNLPFSRVSFFIIFMQIALSYPNRSLALKSILKNRFAYTFTRTSNNITPCVNIWSNKISNCRKFFFKYILVHFSFHTLTFFC